MIKSVIYLITGIYYLIYDSFLMNIYKMVLKCVIIILLLFKYYNNGEYEYSCHNIRINSLFFKQ